MKRRLLLRLGLIALLGSAGLIILLRCVEPSHCINSDGFARLRVGMTEAEVGEILRSAGADGNVMSWTKRNLIDVQVIDGSDNNDSWLTTKEWVADGAAILVHFDEQGSARLAMYFRFKETILEKVRRYLSFS